MAHSTSFGALGIKAFTFLNVGLNIAVNASVLEVCWRGRIIQMTSSNLTGAILSGAVTGLATSSTSLGLVAFDPLAHQISNKETRLVVYELIVFAAAFFSTVLAARPIASLMESHLSFSACAGYSLLDGILSGVMLQYLFWWNIGL